MSRPAVVSKSYATIVTVLAACLAVAVFYYSVFTSFRLTEPTIQLAWQLNFDRTAITFSAGFALAMSLASTRLQYPLSKHISVYVSIVLFAAGLLLGLALSWPPIISTLAGLTLGLAGFYLAGKLTAASPNNNVLLGVGLYSVFLISVVSYLAAVVFADGIGGITLWLFADISRVGVNGYAALCAVSIAAIWLLLSQRSEVASLCLLGLSIGLLGPIMFVGYLVPRLVKRFALSEKKHALVSGFLGGASLTLISLANSLTLGGYAPALIVPLGFIGIPLLLWLSRSHEKQALASASEIMLILLAILISVAIFWHLARFAQQLA